MYIFSYAKHIEVTDKWGSYRNGFKMPDSVMLEHVPVLELQSNMDLLVVKKRWN